MCNSTTKKLPFSLKQEEVTISNLGIGADPHSYQLRWPFCKFMKERFSTTINLSRLCKLIPISYLHKMTSTNGITCGNLNDEAIFRNNTVRASHKGSYPSFLKTPNTKQFSSRNEFSTNPWGEINTIMGVTEEWTASKNNWRDRLRSVMTINAPTKRQR